MAYLEDSIENGQFLLASMCLKFCEPCVLNQFSNYFYLQSIWYFYNYYYCVTYLFSILGRSKWLICNMAYLGKQSL